MSLHHAQHQFLIRHGHHGEFVFQEVWNEEREEGIFTVDTAQLRQIRTNVQAKLVDFKTKTQRYREAGLHAIMQNEEEREEGVLSTICIQAAG